MTILKGVGGVGWREFCGGGEGGLCGGFAEGLAAGGGGVAEVARGGAEQGDEQLGALEVDVVAGEAGGDVAEGLLDGFVGVEAVDEEHVVLDHGDDVVGAVGVAHVVVLHGHGHGAAAGAVLFRLVHALVGAGWFALEILVGVGHDFSLNDEMFCCRKSG
jgi:hypothetical protein